MNQQIDETLLKLLVCTEDGGALQEDCDARQLVCLQCNKRYAISESGIPILLGPKEKGVTRSKTL